MLRRRAVRIGASVLSFSVLATLLLPRTAFAGQAGPGSGGGDCSASGNTLSCGAGQAGSAGTSGGSSAGSGVTTVGSTGSSTGGTATPACPNYIPYPQGGPPPAGEPVPGAWYIDTCAVGNAMSMATGLAWFPTGQAPGTTPIPPDPATAAATAEGSIQLPTPMLGLSPSANAWVNLPEFLSANAKPVSVTANACNAAGVCVSATAVATPATSTWDMGDGSTVACDNLGIPYNPAVPVDQQSKSCSHTYKTSSLGEPSPDGNPNHDAFPITVTVSWAVAWTGPGGSGGTFPNLTTTTSTSLIVEQIESVNN